MALLEWFPLEPKIFRSQKNPLREGGEGTPEDQHWPGNGGEVWKQQGIHPAGWRDRYPSLAHRPRPCLPRQLHIM